MKSSAIVVVIVVAVFLLLETLRYCRHLFCQRYNSVSTKLRFPRTHYDTKPAFSCLLPLEDVLEKLCFSLKGGTKRREEDVFTNLAGLVWTWTSEYKFFVTI